MMIMINYDLIQILRFPNIFAEEGLRTLSFGEGRERWLL